MKFSNQSRYSRIIDRRVSGAREQNKDIAQRELDRRNAEGEDVSQLFVNEQGAIERVEIREVRGDYGF